MDKNFTLRFVAYWVVNTIMLSLADSFFPSVFEIGNKNIEVLPAVIFSSFFLTILLLIARGFARTGNFLVRGRVFLFLYYWGSTSLGLWIIARIANVSGYGIARYTWAIALGFVTAFTHWCLRQSLKGMKLIQTSS